MRIDMSKTPSFPKIFSADFPRLAGGLNLRDLGYLVDSDESPYMKNLMWRNGLLQSRDGQTVVALRHDESDPFYVAEPVYAGYEALFHGYAFFHIGHSLWCLRIGGTSFPRVNPVYYTEVPCLEENGAVTVQVPEDRGTFFRYQDWLFYKNRGGFFRIEYTPRLNPLLLPFTCRDVVHLAEEVDNAPIIVINGNPDTGSGTMYQPENRISALKTVRYTAKEGVALYHLPVQNIDRVVRVKVNGEVVSEYGPDQLNGHYEVNTLLGTVTFRQGHVPDPGNPIVNNTVEITYAKANPDAKSSVMSCRYATVGGGDTNLCILLGGCSAQPNAVFWNSNDELAMQFYYFPMTCYNLVGETEDVVTGFGKQYNDILVFKSHSTGKLAFNIESIDGRSTTSFSYISVNAKIGCDLPWTIQLVENNVVFCNTYQGLHVVLSSSAAFENNIQCISEKINNNESSSGSEINGLLDDVRAGNAWQDPDGYVPTPVVPPSEDPSDNRVVGFDDGERYWLCANGVAYVWDYGVSTYAKPSWFYWTNIRPAALVLDDSNRVFALRGDGKLNLFSRSFSDNGASIDKVYQFPTQHFGTYESLKNVDDIIMSFRSDTASTVLVRYDTDYETRYDLTPVVVKQDFPDQQARRYVFVARRRPGCRHIRQFGLTLENNIAGEDLALVSAQIKYRFTGKER